jgi:hypothetical protein
MTVHLIKLSVGPESLDDLQAWQTRHITTMVRLRQDPVLMHVTRNTPKRAAELLDGGSIYWVIKGWLCARQRVLELRPLMHDGVPHCGIVCDPNLVRVAPRPYRAFQGWRYLTAEDAPRDLGTGNADEAMPEAMRRELTVLGLL